MYIYLIYALYRCDSCLWDMYRAVLENMESIPYQLEEKNSINIFFIKQFLCVILLPYVYILVGHLFLFYPYTYHF